jgi:hypothetical protein
LDEANLFSLLGITLILLGVVFLALPYIGRVIDVDKIPWIIIWVYRSDGFTFATSPILLLVSVISLLLAYFRR